MDAQRHRRPAALFVSLVALVVLAAAALWVAGPGGPGDEGAPGGPAPDGRGTAPVATTTVVPTSPPCTPPPASAITRPTTTTTVGTTTTTSAPTVPPSTVPPVTVPPDDTVSIGDHGDAVVHLQARLRELGYWVPAVDGAFGPDTAHAVTAFQKVSGLPRDGVAGPATSAALATATRPDAGTGGDAVVVDLGRQVVLVVRSGGVAAVLDASTGVVPGTTPVGTFTIFREVDGYDHGPLGTLYRPKYFSGGVALHGYPSVPPTPASHGCVRVTNSAMDWLWSSGVAVVGTRVEVHP